MMKNPLVIILVHLTTNTVRLTQHFHNLCMRQTCAGVTLCAQGFSRSTERSIVRCATVGDDGIARAAFES